MPREPGKAYCPVCSYKDVEARYRFVIKHEDGKACQSILMCANHAYIMKARMVGEHAETDCLLHHTPSTGHVVSA